MKTLLDAAILPSEIAPPADSGTLLEEVAKVATLHARGLHPFAIADQLRQPLRWVLDRIGLRRVDPEILARATPDEAESLLRRLREETAPAIDLVPLSAKVRISPAPIIGRKQREARVFASAGIF